MLCCGPDAPDLFSRGWQRRAHLASSGGVGRGLELRKRRCIGQRTTVVPVVTVLLLLLLLLLLTTTASSPLFPHWCGHKIYLRQCSRLLKHICPLQPTPRGQPTPEISACDSRPRATQDPKQRIFPLCCHPPLIADQTSSTFASTSGHIPSP